MKFPAGQVTLWGIVLLVSVELYFFLYLRQLSGKLGAGEPGWDVPWIGMDLSRLAQSIFFVTIVLLPNGAVALLAWRRIFSLFPRFSLNRTVGLLSIWGRIGELPGAAKTEVFTMIVASLMSVFLTIVCWKSRPHLVVTVPAPQHQGAGEDEILGSSHRSKTFKDSDRIQSRPEKGVPNHQQRSKEEREHSK
jgi:hypothetical protein